ncbi:MAG: CRISPR-associated endonuclease Cas2 [Kocuria sp.]|nr:CRISPR-associated endonuclease Cas2 [Kocuria sp.]
MSHYGGRIQYSVFLFDVSPAAMTRLKCELLELMDSSEDSVLICDLGLTTRVSDKNFQYLGVLKEDRDDSIMIY